MLCVEKASDEWSAVKKGRSTESDFSAQSSGGDGKEHVDGSVGWTISLAGDQPRLGRLASEGCMVYNVSHGR